MWLLDDAAARRSGRPRRARLKSLGREAAGAAPKLVELLQDRDEAVRAAAAEALTAAGPLDDDATIQLAEGLSSEDDVVRARAAEALGTIAAPAEHAAPPLVEALRDGNDVVRARRSRPLGKSGRRLLRSRCRALSGPCGTGIAGRAWRPAAGGNGRGV